MIGARNKNSSYRDGRAKAMVELGESMGEAMTQNDTIADFLTGVLNSFCHGESLDRAGYGNTDVDLFQEFHNNFKDAISALRKITA